MIARAELEGHCLLVLPASNQLILLDSVAAWLWDASQTGLSDNAIASILSEQQQVSPNRVLRDLEQAKRLWKKAGLLDSQQSEAIGPPERFEGDGQQLSTITTVASACYQFGSHRFQIEYDSIVLRDALHPLLQHLCVEPCDEVVDVFAFRKNGSQFALTDRDRRVCFTVENLERALIECMRTLSQWASLCGDNFLILHAAAVVWNERVLLLPGASGDGKTTLTAALTQRGAHLISDDVVPIERGSLLAQPIPLPLCAKEGSWSALADQGIDLGILPQRTRYGRQVRYLPPSQSVQQTPCSVDAIIFPRFQAGVSTTLESVGKLDSLRNVLAARCSLQPQPNQQVLDAFLNWLLPLPAQRLIYSDLDQAISLLEV